MLGVLMFFDIFPKSTALRAQNSAPLTLRKWLAKLGFNEQNHMGSSNFMPTRDEMQ